VYALVKDEFLQEGKVLIERHLTTLPAELYDVLTQKKVILPVGMTADAECGPSWDKFGHDFGTSLATEDSDEEDEEEYQEAA